MKAVIFDLDGVLVDACDWHRVALNEALREICSYEISLEEHYKEFNGLPTKVKLKRLAERGIIENSHKIFDEVEQLKQTKTVEAINRYAFVREEKIKLMEFLRSKNIKIGCYTNSIRKTALLMLEKTGIAQYFDVIITNQEVKRSKPDPEGYNLCIKMLQTTPEQTIIVEDSDNGFNAAKLSGAIVVRVENQEKVNLDLLEDYL